MIIKHNNTKILSDKLREIFKEIWEILKNKKITDRTLDKEVLNIAKKFNISDKNIKLQFSEAEDTVYRAETGRTPYDMLVRGKLSDKTFNIFINNKFGNIKSNTKNDVTTYNNLLRLYLNIREQRLTSEVTINKKTIYNRISGNEIIAYGIFVCDRERRGFNFFLLEEIGDRFYINPRNTMFQVRYNPSIMEPIDYYQFIIKLIDSVIDSLLKSERYIKTEIITLKSIKQQIIELRAEYEQKN
jgi:hypothetical protein